MINYPIRKIYRSEVWKPVLNAVGYEVSNYGGVHSFRRVGSKGKIFDTPQTLLNPALDSDGYCIVTIWTNRKAKTRKVHHLVLEAFVGPCPDGMECRHLDGCRTNNKLNNLKWGTSKDNHQDRIKHGNHRCGENNQNSKLTANEVLKIRAMFCKCNNKALSELFNISYVQICRITSFRSWKHI